MIKITMSPDPVEASRVILRYFQGDRLTRLVSELANYAGFDLTPKF